MATAEEPTIASDLPDHTQLPDSDGAIAENFQELPQSLILTDSIEPVLDAIHPDRRYVIGHDSGIYWKFTDPPDRGCKAPDWFYVPGVPPMLDGRFRRSYVLWHELVAPRILIEFVSGDGSEERDTTPTTGKFWVYERAIRPLYYAIYEVDPGRVEVYRHDGERFRMLEPNRDGRYPIEGMGAELGIWQGFFAGMNMPWLRWWGMEGNLLLTGHEMSDILARQIEQSEQEKRDASQRAEREAARADRLAEQLRALGIEPEA